MERSLWAAVLLSVVLWSSAAYVWHNAFPLPIELLGGDSIEPAKVRAGGVITIMRNLRVIREEGVRINRKIIRGDCTKVCEIIDMPSGIFSMPVGEYKNFSRTHLVPQNASPGVWRIVYTMEYKRAFGRTAIQTLPELTFEVIP